MGAIIWQKVTTCNTSGGGTIMGSFPFPRNGIVKIDYEFILLFKRPGKTPPPSKEAREGARMTTEEWNEYFYGHWNFPGEKQGAHLAAFPLELPARLIRMFTFPGETILDPFLGSGTTSLASLRWNRNSIGYEINPEFRSIIESRLRPEDDLLDAAMDASVEFSERAETPGNLEERIARWSKNASDIGPAELPRLSDPRENTFGSRVAADSPAWERMGRVKELLAPNRIELRDGREIELLGVVCWPEDGDNGAANAQAIEHLAGLIKRSGLRFRDDRGPVGNDRYGPLYVYLSNEKFINAHMIRNGYALADRVCRYRHRERFLKYEEEARDAGRGLWAK
jgi:site-specific DNA-methyltransferase (adenine-specific)